MKGTKVPLQFSTETLLETADSPHQAAERHGFSLGPDADRLHKHPHVLSGAAVDARRLPTLLPARPSAGQSGTARRERTPLLDVSEVTTRAKEPQSGTPTVTGTETRQLALKILLFRGSFVRCRFLKAAKNIS